MGIFGTKWEKMVPTGAETSFSAFFQTKFWVYGLGWHALSTGRAC